LAFPSDVADTCTNIQQVEEEEEEEEEEEDTPHVVQCHNARVWVDFLGDLHYDKFRDIRENIREKCDNKE
jgi:hypothetical protein